MTSSTSNASPGGTASAVISTARSVGAAVVWSTITRRQRRPGSVVALALAPSACSPVPTSRTVTRKPAAVERTHAEATNRFPLVASTTPGIASPSRCGCGPRARTEAHDPDVRPCGSLPASAAPITRQPARSCSKLQLLTRLPEVPAPAGEAPAVWSDTCPPGAALDPERSGRLARIIVKVRTTASRISTDSAPNTLFLAGPRPASRPARCLGGNARMAGTLRAGANATVTGGSPASPAGHGPLEGDPLRRDRELPDPRLMQAGPRLEHGNGAPHAETLTQVLQQHDVVGHMRDAHLRPPAGLA